MSGNRLYSSTLLVVALAFFAVLALDIAFPALVLTLMAAVRQALVTADGTAPHSFSIKRQAA